MWNMNMAQKSQLYNVVLRKVSALPPFPLLSQATKCISFWLISSVLLFFCSYISIILEKAMAPHSSTLAWKIPWTEKPGGLQSMESLRVGHDWATSLSLFTFHFHALEKEMATHSSVLAWRIPRMGEPGGLPSLGSHRVGHDWSDLAAAAAASIIYILIILSLWYKIAIMYIIIYVTIYIHICLYILPYIFVCVSLFSLNNDPVIIYMVIGIFLIKGASQRYHFRLPL